MSQQNRKIKMLEVLPPELHHVLNIEGMLETRTTAPTATTVVKKLSDSIFIYVDSKSSPTVMRLYVYSRSAKK